MNKAKISAFSSRNKSFSFRFTQDLLFFIEDKKEYEITIKTPFPYENYTVITRAATQNGTGKGKPSLFQFRSAEGGTFLLKFFRFQNIVLFKQHVLHFSYWLSIYRYLFLIFSIFLKTSKVPNWKLNITINKTSADDLCKILFTNVSTIKSYCK